MIDKKIELVKTILSSPSIKEGVTQDGFFITGWSNDIRLRLINLSMEFKDIFIVLSNQDNTQIFPQKLNGANITVVVLKHY